MFGRRNVQVVNESPATDSRFFGDQCVKRIFVSIAVLFTFSTSGATGCVLPVPDGGPQSSSPNVKGTIEYVRSGIVGIKQERMSRIVQVRLRNSQPIYTAFGGDRPQSDLRPGQLAEVWFVQCKAPARGIPYAAYFQIFSTDPVDRPRA